jgi:hypothetical protein
MEFSMNIQNDLLKEISKIRSEFNHVVEKLNKKSSEGDQIHNQVSEELGND